MTATSMKRGPATGGEAGWRTLAVRPQMEALEPWANKVLSAGRGAVEARLTRRPDALWALQIRRR